MEGERDKGGREGRGKKRKGRMEGARKERGRAGRKREEGGKEERYVYGKRKNCRTMSKSVCIISWGNGRRSLSSKERRHSEVRLMYFSSVGLEDKGQTCL